MKNKGCVYFFRHIGLTPVKIGFSENISPLKRFNQFKTYAPYGAEIIGFIETLNPAKLEKQLHRKFESKRLIGEWFDITDNEIKKEINFFDLIEKSESKNSFFLAWAKELQRREYEKENPLLEIDYIKSCFNSKSDNDNLIFLSSEEITNILNNKFDVNLSHQNVSKIMNSLGFEKVRKTKKYKYVRGFLVELIN